MKAFDNTIEIINKIRESAKARNEVIKQLYYNEKLKGNIRKFIFKKGGSEEDVDDIFNYTLVQFIKTVTTKENFTINSTLESYLFGIAKNLWFQKLKTQLKNKTESLELVKYNTTTDFDPEEILMTKEKKEIIEKALGELGKNCKEVLKLWAKKYSMKEIAEKMEYKSEMMARKKKCNCQKELFIYLEKNPNIVKELKQ